MAVAFLISASLFFAVGLIKHREGKPYHAFGNYAAALALTIAGAAWL